MAMSGATYARNPEANVVLKHERLDPDLYGGTSPKKYCIYSFILGPKVCQRHIDLHRRIRGLLP